jgi:hypothetical protein
MLSITATPSTWPVTRWPPSSSPTLSERSRLIFVPGSPLADQGLGQGLGGSLDLEDAAGLAVGARAQARHGQAHAGTGDRGADLDAGGVIGAGDGETLQAGALAVGFHDRADGGDDAGEHQPVLTKCSKWSGPIRPVSMQV